MQRSFQTEKHQEMRMVWPLLQTVRTSPQHLPKILNSKQVEVKK